MKITITIKPAGYSQRGPRYEAYLNGTRLCVSTTPFLSAARVLLREGVPTKAVLAMRWEGGVTDCLTSTVGKAAGLTVRETARDGPMFVTYKGAPEGPQVTPRGGQSRTSASLPTTPVQSVAAVS